MENRCGGERERDEEGGTKGGKQKMDAPSSKAEIKAGVRKVCVSVCASRRRVRLTVCVRVAVEALAGRSAAEV